MLAYVAILLLCGDYSLDRREGGVIIGEVEMIVDLIW